jgi:WD40 repeat protein
VISGSDDRTIRVWEIDSAKEMLKIPLVRQWPRSIAVTSDGRFAVTAAESSTVKVWNLETGAEVQSFRGHTARVNSVAIVDAQRVVSGSDDHTVRVWDLESGQPLSVLSGHDAKVNAVAAFAGRKLVVSASDDCDVRVWDVTTKGLLATYTLESPVLTCVGSPETPEIVVGDRSGLVHFFSLEGVEDLPVVHG